MTDEQQQERKPQHGAVAYICISLFEELLDLPEGVRVRGIYLDAPTGSILLHLEGDSLPLVTPGVVPERAWVSVEVQPTPLGGQIVTRLKVHLPLVEGE